MARIRSIKPELWENEALASLSFAARLLFIGLVSHSDDEGRQRGNPAGIRSRVFPCNEEISASEITSWLEELEAIGMILCYEVAGAKCLQVVNFVKHQRISHPKPSSIPSADAPHMVRTFAGGCVSGREGSGRDRSGEGMSEPDGSDTPTGEVIERPEVDELCILLADSIAADGSKRPEPLQAHWRDECRRLLDLDGATVEQVRYVIGWVQTPGNFWAANILSMGKLRKQWTALVKEIKRNSNGTGRIAELEALKASGW